MWPRCYMGTRSISALMLDRGLCQIILFHVCFDHKPLWNPAVLGRTPRPGAEPFPKPRPQPIFPRRARLHVPHTYNRWNAHHISGPCSYSAACAFQLWSSIVFPFGRGASPYTALSHSSVLFPQGVFLHIELCSMWDITWNISGYRSFWHHIHFHLMDVVRLLVIKDKINNIRSIELLLKT